MSLPGWQGRLEKREWVLDGSSVYSRTISSYFAVQQLFMGGRVFHCSTWGPETGCWAATVTAAVYQKLATHFDSLNTVHVVSWSHRCWTLWLLQVIRFAHMYNATRCNAPNTAAQVANIWLYWSHVIIKGRGARSGLVWDLLYIEMSACFLERLCVFDNLVSLQLTSWLRN